MDLDFPELQWPDNPKKSNGAVMDERTSTYFIFLDKVKEDFNSFKDWAKTKSITVNYSNDTYKISSVGKSIAIVQTFDGGILLRISQDDVTIPYCNMIIDFFENYYALGKVRHGETEFPIEKTNIIAKSWTWDHDDQANVIPLTFFEFTLDKKLIAKMNLIYFNWEMCEMCPTISLFEVAKGLKRKGYGKKIINSIEEWLKNQGFFKLFLEDTKSPDFWRKMGYTIDIDEGYKYLLDEDN